MHRLLIPVITVSLAAFILLAGCKKQEQSPANHTATGNAISVDSVTGSYTGTTKRRYIHVGTMGTHSDSSEKADTFIISKVLPDSFSIDKLHWLLDSTAYKYTDTNVYYRKRGDVGFNQSMAEVTITFSRDFDSVYMQLHTVSMGSEMLQVWEDFSGKK